MKMSDEKEIVRKPIFFERNRVKRVYDGGKLFADFFGDEPIDNKYPEEWVASAVKAINRDTTDPKEGLSVVKDTDITLKELIEKYPEEVLGTRKSFDLLVKLLDSAIRLPIQAHPDKEFSRKYFNSEYGKTEMWVILATRENASIGFGFKNKITSDEFSKAIENSKFDKEAMTPLMNRVYVKSGDVFLIPSKCVHAIGYGCLLLEVQEPTDFTIQPEHWCGDYELDNQEMYMCLDKNIALECFDYSLYGEKSLEIARKSPKKIVETKDFTKESLVTYEDTPCFACNRYIINSGRVLADHAPAIYVVTTGEGSIVGEDYCHDIKKGDYFFMPSKAIDKFYFTSNSKLEIIECLPPK